jgi:CDGSH-type Zn-finger protein
MANPKIADLKPMIKDLNEGETVYWCACGQSNNQPFCDGSHQGTEFNPLPYTAEKTGKVPFCMCKHTKNPPRCDGSHTSL